MQKSKKFHNLYKFLQYLNFRKTVIINTTFIFIILRYV